MHDRTARLFTGLGLLILVWIFVYWAWPVGEPPVTTSPVEWTAEDRAAVEAERDAEARENRPAPLVIDQSRRGPSIAMPADPVVPETVVPPAVERPGGTEGGVIPPKFEDYVIKPGDLGWERISERVYGTRAHWRAVSGANPLKDPRKLRVGEVIRVPVDPANVQGLPVEPDGTVAERPSTPEPSVIEYTVKRGDTLSGIATSFYGSQRYVDFLYNANRGRLASKDDLRLGQVLLVPPLPAGERD